MSNKSICLVSAQYLPHVGGVENFVYNISRELAGRGHEITIITSGYGDLPTYEKDGNIEIYRLPSLSLMNGRFPVLKRSRELKELKAVLSLKHIDIMLINVRFYFLSLTMAKLAKRLGIRSVIMDHGSSHLNTGGRLTTKLSEWFEHWITWREKKHCKEFVGVSKESLRWIKHFKIDASYQIPNAIDVSKFDGYLAENTRSFRAEYGVPEGAVLICFVGRITVEKGVRELINVMNRINETRDDVYLLLAGDGYLTEELSKIKSEATHFVGRINASDVAALLRDSDIFCLPSYSEGFPTSVIEASLCGSFVVTTAKGDAKEIIKSRDYGIILPDANEEGLYEALMSVLDEREYREAAIARAREVVLNNYTWYHSANALLNLINEKENSEE